MDSEIVDALPTGGAPNRALLRNALISRIIYPFSDDEDPSTMTALDPETGAVPMAYYFGGSLFKLDPDDTTTDGDYVTVIETSDGYRYKLAGFDLLPLTVLSATIADPPADPEAGDSYLVPSAPTGDWIGHVDAIGVYTPRGWQFIEAKIGFWVYVQATDVYIRYTAAGQWKAGAGLLAFSDNSIPLSAIIGSGGSLTIKVENQTTEAPPGARVTGGTPTVPLGGTAANINDNNTATTSVTSALGDLSAAAVASRIIQRIDYGANKSLIAIEAKQLRLSTGTGSAGLYYSTNGTTWTQLGASLSLTAVAADFRRTGSVTARYVAVILDQANYSTKTATIGDLNSYDGTVVAAVGVAYIVGPNPIGSWAGKAGKIAICEIANAFTFYTQGEGDVVYDKTVNARVQWNGAAWIGDSGLWLDGDSVFTTTGNFDDATTVAVGDATYTYSATVAPQSSVRHGVDKSSLTIAAKATGNILQFSYSGDYQYAASGIATPAGNVVFALLRDSETDAIAWHYHRPMTRSAIAGAGTAGVVAQEDVNFTFQVAAPDASSHVYKIICTSMVGTSNRVDAFSPTRRLFTWQERQP